MKLTKLLLCACLFTASNLMAQSEETAILLTVNNFLEGGTNGEVDRFKSAFLPDAVQRSIGKNGVTGMSVESLVSKIKPNQKMERTTKVVSWSYAGTCATAITETEYPTSKIVDILNLLKVNNEWKVTSRVYSRIEKEETVTSSNPPALASNTKPGAKGAAAKPAAKPKKPVADDGWE